ncbi:MAG: hypothetical protein QXZ53_07800 [Candidatus Bathyarchaeia archaeon]
MRKDKAYLRRILYEISKKVALIKRGNKIEVAPIELNPPSALFDTIKIPEEVNFTDPHSLKKALLELRGT